MFARVTLGCGRGWRVGLALWSQPARMEERLGFHEPVELST